MDITLLDNKITNGRSVEHKHEYPGRGTEGVNIMVWGTLGSATVTLQLKTPDGTWINTSVTFTTVGEKNVLVKGGRTVALNVTGASGSDISAILTP